MASKFEKLSVVSVGGGTPSNSSDFLELGVEMSGVEYIPHILIIPTAKSTEENHTKGVRSAKKLYEDKLGLSVEVLHEFDQMPAVDEVKEKIDWADVVYISGGDSDRMMNIWEQHGIDNQLIKRALGGLVLTGISAGAIAPFNWGYSDSLSYRVEDGQPWDYIAVNGLGVLNSAITPHANKFHDGELRANSFHTEFVKDNIQRNLKYGFAVDNKAALVISNGILTSRFRDSDGVRIIENSGNDSYREYQMNSGDSILIDTL